MARDEDGPRRRSGAAVEPTVEARLDARLKAMFRAIEKEKPSVVLPDLERLPRSRRGAPS